MLDHHIQRTIVYKLALTNSLTFTELKPAELENKLFTYHLKKVIGAGYVRKNDNGSYELTSEGRRVGVHVHEDMQALVDRAYSVLFLAIKRKTDNAWLFYKRGNQPLIGKTGFMHCVPNVNEAVAITAKRECFEKTGLEVNFKPLGGGFFRVFNDDMVESFTHFTLLLSESVGGRLVQNDPLAEYFWQMDDKAEAAPDLLPNMPFLLRLAKKAEPFFVEQTLSSSS